MFFGGMESRLSPSKAESKVGVAENRPIFHQTETRGVWVQPRIDVNSKTKRKTRLTKSARGWKTHSLHGVSKVD